MNSNFHVLLVDDDAALHNTVREALALDRASLTSAFDATGALELLAAGQFDLLLLDLGLPDLDGIELLHRLRTEGRLKFMPVIALTGWASTSDKVGGLEAGASDYITKPVEVAELRARVRAILRQWNLQQELRRMNAQLEQALRLAEAGTRTKNQFLANISHEFRTPLNGVIASSGLLLSSRIPADQRELVETIQLSGEALLAKVTDVLDYARMEEGDFKLNVAPFSLRECLGAAVIALAAPSRRKGLELIFDIQPSLPDTFIGDSERLRQVVFRLVDNAVKFTGQGEVVVRVSGESVCNAKDGTGALDTPWQINVEVADTGCGMSAAQLGEVFKFFTQADDSDTRRHGGMGLGLALADRVVHEMGGKLTAQSTPDIGSVFSFKMRMPCCNPAPHRFPSFSCLEGKRCVVITRNNALRASIEQTLSSVGVSPLEGVPNTPCPPDGFRPDFWLIDFDGKSDDDTLLADSIKGTATGAAPARVIGLCDSDPGALANLRGFDGLVEKPVMPDRLIVAISKTLETAKAEPKAAVKPEVAPGMRMLVVDDNSINLRIATRMLEKIGISPDTAPDGVQAVEAARTQHYDLIMMDSQMPEMDGCAATAAIRQIEATEQRKRSIIIAMTANAFPEEKERCRLAGMDDFATKPVRIEMLEALIRK